MQQISMEVVVGQFLQEGSRLENEGGKDDLRHTHLVESQTSNSKRLFISQLEKKREVQIWESKVANIDFPPYKYFCRMDHKHTVLYNKVVPYWWVFVGSRTLSCPILRIEAASLFPISLTPFAARYSTSIRISLDWRDRQSALMAIPITKCKVFPLWSMILDDIEKLVLEGRSGTFFFRLLA